MKVLIAPDKFKDALAAPEVCEAMAAGVRDAQPDAEVVTCPLADGGEGTGALLAQAIGAEPRTASVLDPLRRLRSARWWLTPDRATAIVEMAEASGLWLLPPPQRKATQTTSYGTGQLLGAAIAAGARRVLLCVGGSATVDGGAGCLQALGWELRDRGGRVLAESVGGGALADVRELLSPAQTPSVPIEVLCDVDNPLTGQRGAAPVFAPQKGASPEEVAQLSAGLTTWAETLERATGRAVGDVPGGGAAGGLPAALAAALNARLASGFDVVAERVELDAKLRGCDLCLTGEGRLDEQTLAGKVVGGVVRHARVADVPVVAFVGAVRARAEGGVADLAAASGAREVIVITPAGTPKALALSQTAVNLQRAVANCLAAGGHTGLGTPRCSIS